MTMSDPERIGDILPRVLADIKCRTVKQRPKPAPVGGSMRAAMMDFFDGKMPKARPDGKPGPEPRIDPDDLKDTPF
jgi:hypothetical protein